MNTFPEPIRSLPEADLPFPGATAHLLQGQDCQMLFMAFSRDVDLPEHSHAAQWAVVLEGRIEMTIGGVRREYAKGERYFIPAGVPHSGRIFAGYSDITFFGQNDRYGTKKP